MENRILVIYLKKETQEYHHFEIYPLSKTLTKEYVIKTVENFNADDSKELSAKIYDDPVLMNFAEDVRSSCKNQELIKSLKSICGDIQDSISELESWREDIEDIFKKNDEQEGAEEF